MSPGCVCQKRAQCLLTRCFSVEHLADKTRSTCALHHGILPPRTMLFPACHSLPFSPWSLASQRTLFSTHVPRSQYRVKNVVTPIPAGLATDLVVTVAGGLTLSLLIDSSAMDTHCFTQEQLWQKCRIGHKFSRKVLAFHRDVSHTVPSTSLK